MFSRLSRWIVLGWFVALQALNPFLHAHAGQADGDAAGFLHLHDLAGGAHHADHHAADHAAADHAAADQLALDYPAAASGHAAQAGGAACVVSAADHHTAEIAVAQALSQPERAAPPPAGARWARHAEAARPARLPPGTARPATPPPHFTPPALAPPAS